MTTYSATAPCLCDTGLQDSIFNRRVRVEFIRHGAKRYGFGRIHVKRKTLAGAEYLAKYLSKQGRASCLQGKRLWACFGKFPDGTTRVKDIEVESDFTRAIKFCQEELKMKKLPYAFTTALMHWPVNDPVKLKLACTMLRKVGPHYKDILRVLRA